MRRNSQVPQQNCQHYHLYCGFLHYDTMFSISSPEDGGYMLFRNVGWYSATWLHGIIMQKKNISLPPWKTHAFLISSVTLCGNSEEYCLLGYKAMQSGRISMFQTNTLSDLVGFLLVFLLALNMEVIRASQTFVNYYRTIQHYTP
jgi:hypothetical protein